MSYRTSRSFERTPAVHPSSDNLFFWLAGHGYMRLFRLYRALTGHRFP